MNDFYEDDEPVEEIIAAFEQGPHGVTGHPDGTRFKATGLVLEDIRTTVLVLPQVKMRKAAPARPAVTKTDGVPVTVTV